MCGLFGFAAKNKTGVDLRTLRRIAEVTEQRGSHAWGMAWMKRGRLNSFKQPGRVTSALDVLQMAEGAELLIGHTRMATHGSPSDNLNNHPHAVPGQDAFVCHNGVIRDYEAIAERHRLTLHSECDSEVLAAMVGKFRGKPHSRFHKAASEAAGQSPFAMLALYPDQLLAVRANGQPLHVGETRDAFWIGSLAVGLPGKVSPLRENMVAEIGGGT
jgi:glucosamine 6-phosphate synthetase-like amidotransferase/phosphosugar isomerase protein